MRITTLSIDGLLSFDDFSTDLGEAVTVIVGPNGTGKSNIGRAIDLLLAALRSADRQTPEAQQLLDLHAFATVADPARNGIELRAGVTFTGQAEQEFIVSYVQACIGAAAISSSSGIDTAPLDAWLSGNVTAAELQPLMRGTVVLTHSGTADGAWHVGYEFDAPVADNVHAFQWVLRDNAGRTDTILHVDDIGKAGSSGGESLRDRLFRDRTPAQRQAVQLPDGFGIEVLLPANYPVAFALDLNSATMIDAVRRCIGHFGVDVDADNNRHYSFGSVLARVLSRALTRTSDTGLRLNSAHRADEIRNDTDNLAQRLLYLKNAPSHTRARYDRLLARFANFSNGRQIDVVLSTATSQDQPLPHAEPRLLVTTDPTPEHHRDTIRQVPLEFAGSGAQEALTLAFALDSTADSIVVLDEPAARLHPTMQRRLASDVLVNPAQIVLITHSPFVVPYSQDKPRPHFLRFVREPGQPTRATPVPTDALDLAMDRVRSGGNEGLPFAAKAILCEGETDVAAIHALAQRLGIDLGAINTLVVDCKTRNNQPRYITFTDALAVPTLVISDGDFEKSKSNPQTKRDARLVRDAVAASSTAVQVEFTDDMETALQTSKSSAVGRRTADLIATVDLDEHTEIAMLAATLAQFCSGDRQKPSDPGQT